MVKNGRFLRVSNFNDALLTKFFSREVFSLLLRKQLINLTLVQKILRWRHTGFNVHTGVRATSKDETERVGKMLVIAFIEDPKIIDKIIAHLKLTFHAEPPPSPRLLQQELLMAAEEKKEYF